MNNKQRSLVVNSIPKNLSNVVEQGVRDDGVTYLRIKIKELAYKVDDYLQGGYTKIAEANTKELVQLSYELLFLLGSKDAEGN